LSFNSHHSLHIQGKTKKETQRRRLKVKVASATAVPPVMKNPTVSNQTKMDAVSNILPVALTQIESSLTTTSQAVNSMFAFALSPLHGHSTTSLTDAAFCWLLPTRTSLPAILTSKNQTIPSEQVAVVEFVSERIGGPK
jgi:hypothetical protein